MFGFLPVVAAAAAMHLVDVPATFGHKVQKAEKGSGGVAVLLPDGFYTSYPKLYPDISTSAGRWELDLGLAKGCHDGGACGYASFSGDRAGRLFGKRRVKLRDGYTGHYAKSHCGASCSSPTIGWRQDGVVYTFSLDDIRGSVREGLKRLANSAIDGGPR
jgi:hypothetical protein